MIAARRDTHGPVHTLTALPVAAVFRYATILTKVARAVPTAPFVSFFNRNRESGVASASTLSGLEKRGIVSAQPSRLRLNNEMVDIVEDVFESVFVVLDRQARAQGVSFTRELRGDASDITSKTLRRLSPNRARGKTKVALTQSINSNQNRKRIAKLARENAAIVTDFGKTRVKRLAILTSRALRDGWTTERFAKAIANETGVSQRRAFNLARDQTMRINSSLTKDLANDSGAKRFQWIHSGNVNGRPIHIRRNRKMYAYKRPPSELPGELNNCMCLAVPQWK